MVLFLFSSEKEVESYLFLNEHKQLIKHEHFSEKMYFGKM